MSVQQALQRLFTQAEITPNVLSNGGYIVSAMPRPGTPAPAYEPFPLAIPQSFLNGLYVLGEYQAQDQRHLAVLLLVETRTRQWKQYLPKQTSHPRGISWQIDTLQLSCLASGTVIAGSFQCRPEGGDNDATAVVPPFNGLHVVAGIMGDDKRCVRLFVRHGEQVDRVSPPDVVFDDWMQTLQRHLPRMTRA